MKCYCYKSINCFKLFSVLLKCIRNSVRGKVTSLLAWYADQHELANTGHRAQGFFFL